MTARDMVSVIAAALLAHKGDHHQDDWWTICKCGENWPVGGDCKSSEVAAEFAAHQARAVLAAISEAGAVEWGVAGRNGYVNEYETEADARLQVATRDGYTLWSRPTFPWVRAE